MGESIDHPITEREGTVIQSLGGWRKRDDGMERGRREREGRKVELKKGRDVKERMMMGCKEGE